MAYRLSYNLYLVVISLYSKVAVIIKRFWSFTEKRKYFRYIYWGKNHRVEHGVSWKKNLLQVKFKHLKFLEYWCWYFSNILRCSYQYLDCNLVENQEHFRKHMKTIRQKNIYRKIRWFLMVGVRWAWLLEITLPFNRKWFMLPINMSTVFSIWLETQIEW